MSNQQVLERPIRAGVFSTLSAAQEAVSQLLQAGFTTEQITVLCSDETKERHFREFEHQQPSGTMLPEAATAGSAIGAAVGGLAATAAGVAAGNATLAFAGAAAGVCTGGVLGGFLGAMMTRGIERETADFYDQAVEDGEIHVSVDVHGDHAESKLAHAEQILAATGAKAIPLAES